MELGRRLLPARRLLERRETRAMLGMLLLTDLLFVVAHVLHVTEFGGLLDDPDFALNQDRGFGELFGYLKLLWSVMLLALATRRHRAPLLAALTALIAALVVDDALSVHERLGAVLGARLGLSGPGAMESFDLGQVVFGALAGLALAAVVVALWHGASPVVRRTAAGTVASVVLLGVFAVLVDAVHAVAGEVLDEPLRILEEGGELVAMTGLLVWLTWTTLEDA
jgi:hypothetical protein